MPWWNAACLLSCRTKTKIGSNNRSGSRGVQLNYTKAKVSIFSNIAMLATGNLVSSCGDAPLIS